MDVRVRPRPTPRRLSVYNNIVAAFVFQNVTTSDSTIRDPLSAQADRNKSPFESAAGRRALLPIPLSLSSQIPHLPFLPLLVLVVTVSQVFGQQSPLSNTSYTLVTPYSEVIST